MIKNNLNLILIIFSVLTIISNYKVFDSNIKQHLLIQYLSSGTISEIPNNYLERISTNYPTLSSTVIPFKSITGTYWIQNDSIIKGLDLLRTANKENPNLGFPDAMLAGFHDYLGLKDSFNFYAKQAYNKLPNAPQHYVLITKMFVNQNKIDSLEQFFNLIKSRIRDKQVYRIYFSAAIKNKEKFDTISLNENIKNARSYFDRDEDISLLTDYLIYGEQKIKDIIKLKQQAIDSFQINPNNSIDIMEKIIREVDDNVDLYETLIEMYFRVENYTKVINLHQALINSEFKIKAFIIEFIAISYINLNLIQSGCELAQTLNNYNYSISPSLGKLCNINQN